MLKGCEGGTFLNRGLRDGTSGKVIFELRKSLRMSQNRSEVMAEVAGAR